MSVKLRGKVWWVFVSVGGQRIRKSAGIGATKAQAKQLEAKIRQDLAQGRVIGHHTLDEAALKWWDTEGIQQRGKSVKAQLRSLIPYIEGKPIREAPAVAQDAWRDWQQAGIAPGTIKRRLGVLKRICNVAYRQWNWIDQPVAEKISMPRVNNERHIYLTMEQVQQVIDACPLPDVADAIWLAAYTGLRKSELLRLMNGEIEVRKNCIILDSQTKSGKPRVIPCPPQIEPIISKLPIPMDRHRLYEGWDVAREVCGLKSVRWHDLRHTYASWLVQNGASIKAVQELLGHSDLSITQRYSHLAPHHLVDAVAKLAAVTGADVEPIRKEILSGKTQ